ncbi:MAG: hypothetical protein JJE37_16245 [Methyloceanibacter sp.]|nr:hypothetical protein [Methyloceanibacter sp.]
MQKQLPLIIMFLALLSPGLLWADAPAKPTDPQIAHIAYTAGLLDVEAGKQAPLNILHRVTSGPVELRRSAAQPRFAKPPNSVGLLRPGLLAHIRHNVSTRRRDVSY